jgi:hypothetical protein
MITQTQHDVLWIIAKVAAKDVEATHVAGIRLDADAHGDIERRGKYPVGRCARSSSKCKIDQGRGGTGGGSTWPWRAALLPAGLALFGRNAK